MLRLNAALAMKVCPPLLYSRGELYVMKQGCVGNFRGGGLVTPLFCFLGDGAPMTQNPKGLEILAPTRHV